MGFATLAVVGMLAGPTWYRDVLPIVQDRCQGCHVSGGIAPFPLLRYEDAVARHPRIASAVASRYMPPWKPSAACHSYRDSRALTQEQIDTLLAWSAAGAPAGEPADAPPAPAPRAGLERVDLTLDAGADYLPQPHTHTGHPSDDYRCFLLDPKLGEDRDLVGIDLQPGVPSQVHHILLFSSALSDAQRADAAEPGAGWTCFGGPGTGGINTVGAWAPGSGAWRVPEGTGLPLRAGEALVLQVHYNLANGPAAPDRTRVQLQLAPGRVERPATMVPLADLRFAIPPGASGHTTRVAFATPAPIRIWGVGPHMHTLGRQITVTAGDTCLVDIPQWDFHWQQGYFFAEPEGLRVEAGTPLTLSCTWDNPTSSTVRWGEGTADEMCLAYLYVTY